MNNTLQKTYFIISFTFLITIGHWYQAMRLEELSEYVIIFWLYTT